MKIREKYYLLKPTDINHSDFILENLDTFDRVACENKIELTSLVSLFEEIPLKDSFKKNNNENILPGNYILAEGSYRHILKYVKEIKEECNIILDSTESDSVQEGEEIELEIYNLYKYECNPKDFTHLEDNDKYEVMIVADILDDLTGRDCENCELRYECDKYNNVDEDEFSDDFKEYVESLGGEVIDEVVTYDYIKGFYNKNNNRVEIFRLKSEIIYYEKTSSKVYSFQLKENLIADSDEGKYSPLENENYLEDYYNDQIVSNRERSEFLIMSNNMQIQQYDDVFWDDVVEILIHNPSTIEITQRSIKLNK